MAVDTARSYAERSRDERGAELAQAAGARDLDASMLMGLTVLAAGKKAHLDYTGGIDTTTINRRIASWARIGVWPRIWPILTNNTTRSPRRQEDGEGTTEVKGKEKEARSISPASLKEAVSRVFPVDYQCQAVHSILGETAAARQARVRAEYGAKEEYFAPVLSRVDTKAMAQLALDRFRKLEGISETTRLPLPQIDDPFFGSAHVFYLVQFCKDGLGEQKPAKWLMKIPALGPGGSWDELSCNAVKSEALLLVKLRRDTSVPVPGLIDANHAPDNKIHAPYLLMEHVQGKRLEHVWFGHDVDGGMRAGALKLRRKKILRNIAKAMVQLGRYDFDRGGSPVFENLNIQDVNFLPSLAGPSRELDVQAMVHRWLGDDRAEVLPLYADAGPWDDTTAMYTAMLDAYVPRTEAEQGVDVLLRLLVRQIREPDASRARRFVLAHPDVSMRNILVADDCTSIRAILGWDGARAVPHSLGNESFPQWLVRDFNPFVWRWKPAADFWRTTAPQPECNRFEDAPWVLRELRDDYTRIMRELKGRGKSGKGKDGEEGEEEEEVDMTRQSLLALTLDAAVRDARCRTAVLRRLLEKSRTPLDRHLSFDNLVWSLSGVSTHEASTLPLADVIGNAGGACGPDELTLACLRRNVAELASKGFVRGAVVW